MPIRKVLITGGAGFIGSHLTDRLMRKGSKVTIIDNLSSGTEENIRKWLNNPNLTFIKGDLKSSKEINRAVQGSEIVFHLAANPEVQVGETNPIVHFRENLEATFCLLEAMKKNKSARTLVFSSSSTIYGEAFTVPTPEEYGPLTPISTYGASKLGCEALITSYAHTFNLRALILRLANVLGSRSTRGVIPDLITKLKTNPNRLEILGDGNQNKSYLHINDCLDAILHATRLFVSNKSMVNVYNIGSPDQIAVKEIAEIITEEMNMQDVIFSFKGEVDGRGWKGDVKNMCLSIEKLCETGWKPKYGSEQSVRLVVRSILTGSPSPRYL